MREDTVRLWRCGFMKDGVGTLRATVAPGPVPVKSETALRVAVPLLAEPIADRRHGRIPRPRAEIQAREGGGASVTRRCPRLCEKKFRWRRPRYKLKGRHVADDIELVGLGLQP